MENIKNKKIEELEKAFYHVKTAIFFYISIFLIILIVLIFYHIGILQGINNLAVAYLWVILIPIAVFSLLYLKYRVDKIESLIENRTLSRFFFSYRIDEIVFLSWIGVLKKLKEMVLQKKRELEK